MTSTAPLAPTAVRNNEPMNPLRMDSWCSFDARAVTISWTSLEPDLCQLGSGPVLLSVVHVRLLLLPMDSERTALVAPALALLFDDFAGWEPENHGNHGELQGDEFQNSGNGSNPSAKRSRMIHSFDATSVFS